MKRWKKSCIYHNNNVDVKEEKNNFDTFIKRKKANSIFFTRCQITIELMQIYLLDQLPFSSFMSFSSEIIMVNNNRINKPDDVTSIATANEEKLSKEGKLVIIIIWVALTSIPVLLVFVFVDVVVVSFPAFYFFVLLS